MGNSVLSEVDDTSILRTGLSTCYWRTSQLATGLSALAPAQRAGAQRLCALAHRDLASRIHVRNAPKADKPEPTRMTHFDRHGLGRPELGCKIAFMLGHQVVEGWSSDKGPQVKQPTDFRI